MAKKKQKRKKSEFQIKKTPIIAVILILAVIVLTIAENKGYNPIGWIKGKLGSLSSEVNDDLSVHFIDVGQGDCIYISAGEENMLIDCGEADQSGVVTSYLNKLGVEKIDHVIATHPHSDHMGGMSEIIKSYDIGEFIMPHLPDSDIPTTRYFERFLDACEAADLSVTEAEVGRIIGIGEAKAEIIAPNSEKYNNKNNYSVSLILTHGDNSFLFSGDAEKESEEEMLSSGRLHHVTVYKAGHHGSSTSSSKDFIEAISPDYAVIMCGAGNSYGHPHHETLETLAEYVKQVYRTDLCGNIVFESDGTVLTIRTER